MQRLPYVKASSNKNSEQGCSDIGYITSKLGMLDAHLCLCSHLGAIEHEQSVKLHTVAGPLECSSICLNMMDATVLLSEHQTR